MDCKNLKWKDHTSSLTTMTQTKNRTEHARDSISCDLRINNTHGPLKECSSDARWPILTMIDQKHRSGKVALTTKTSRGMCRHRNWLLDSSGWIACLARRKLNDGDF